MDRADQSGSSDPLFPEFSRNNKENEYIVYKKRWFMLFVLTLLNFSNGVLWISFAPIDDRSADYYHVSSSDIDWLSVVYPVAALPFSMISAWIIDTYGLRHGMVLASWFNGVGSIIRIVSMIHVAKPQPFIIVMIGQSLAAIAQTLMLPLPTKLAGLWFEDSHRVLANMITSTANTIGILVASLVSPHIVTSPDDIPVMLIVYSVPAILVMILATFGVTTSKPPTPPSSSALHDSETFFTGLKHALKSKPFLILMISFGSGIGMFSALTTLIEQIICVHNYSDNVAGNLLALSIGFGFIGAALASLYVDKTKKFEELSKCFYAFAAISVIFFALISQHANHPILLGLSTSLFGFFAIALLPLCLELGVECTYPVAEATSASLLWLTGQITMIIIVLVSQGLGKSLTENEEANSRCKSKNLDMTNATYFMAIFTIVITLFFIIFFKAKYKRMEAEKNILKCSPTPTNC